MHIHSFLNAMCFPMQEKSSARFHHSKFLPDCIIISLSKCSNYITVEMLKGEDHFNAGKSPLAMRSVLLKVVCAFLVIRVNFVEQGIPEGYDYISNQP